MSYWFKSFSCLLVVIILLAACVVPQPTVPQPAGEAKATEAPPAEAAASAADLVFFSTQFSPIEEQEKFRAILTKGGFDFTASEEGPLLW